MTINPTTVSPHLPVRPDWLSKRAELAIDPELEVVDSHHHLWDRLENPYTSTDFLTDAKSGHRLASSIFIECGARYRTEGPAELRPVGEVEFAASAAHHAIGSGVGLCAAIVGNADLTNKNLEGTIEAENEASGGRLRGIRQIAAWHPDPTARASLASPPPDLLSDARFSRGLAVLAASRLSLDIFVYHTQLADVLAIARRHPELTIVLDHIGGPIGIGPYAGRRHEVFAEWETAMRALAGCRNVRVKLTGFGMRLLGFGVTDEPLPPTSDDLAALWFPYVTACIDMFGVERCMFGSNYPVDKGTCSYVVLWNAFKKITAAMTPAERHALFSQTARRTYRLMH